MTDETAVGTLYETHVTPNLQIVRYELPAVGSGTIGDMIRLHLPQRIEGGTGVRGEGVLHGMKIASDSTNFDVFFFNEAAGVKDTLSEVRRYEAIDKFENDYDALRENMFVFVNRDDPREGSLYCKIENNGNASGIIHLELYIS